MILYSAYTNDRHFITMKSYAPKPQPENPKAIRLELETILSEDRAAVQVFSGAELPQDEFRAQIRQLIADNRWIMDELANL